MRQAAAVAGSKHSCVVITGLKAPL
ncbi:uncharacterized protein METZ01_LOCUS512700 [marine metagenome]|uniref:Uncharacterized protein n=1 Tax=marine metagenome TaxID=408172 RepID=A0A383ESF7_9ZZZZ